MAFRLFDLPGTCLLIVSVAFELVACSPKSSESEKAGSQSAKVSSPPVSPATTSGANLPSGPQWHWLTDRLTGKTGDKAEMLAVLEGGVSARVIAGCDDRDGREIAISFLAPDGTPVSLMDVSSDRVVDSQGKVQNFTPAKNGSNTALIVLYRPRDSHNDTYGEVQDNSIPEKVEVALSNGQTPVIDLHNQDSILQRSMAGCAPA